MRLNNSLPRTSWSIPCAAVPPPEPESALICSTCRKNSGRPRKLPIPTTIQRVNGASGPEKENRKKNSRILSALGKDGGQFLRRDYFELSVRAVRGFFVSPPSAELRGVTKAISLHAVVGHLDN